MWHSGGERDKTGKLSSGDKSLSAHPASIRAPAAADVKWIQHFLSHYPISLQYSGSSTFKSAGQSTHTPLPPSPWSDAIFSSWLFGKVHCFFSGSLGLALFDLTVLNHFTCLFVFYTSLIAMCAQHLLPCSFFYCPVQSISIAAE